MSENLIQTRYHSLMRLLCSLITFLPPTLNVCWSSKVLQAWESIQVWASIPGHYPQQKSGKPTRRPPFRANWMVGSATNECPSLIHLIDTLSVCINFAALLVWQADDEAHEQIDIVLLMIQLSHIFCWSSQASESLPLRSVLGLWGKLFLCEPIVSR